MGFIMKIPNKVLMKKKISFRSIPTERLEKILEFERAKLENIKSTKKFYNGCYTDDENRLYYSQPVQQIIDLIEMELKERKSKETEEAEEASL